MIRTHERLHVEKDKELTRMSIQLKEAERVVLELQDMNSQLARAREVKIQMVSHEVDAQAVLRDVIEKKDQQIQQLECKIKHLRAEFQESLSVTTISPRHSPTRACVVCSTWSATQVPEAEDLEKWASATTAKSTKETMLAFTTPDLAGLGNPTTMRIRGALTYEFGFLGGHAVQVYYPNGKNSFLEIMDARRECTDVFAFPLNDAPGLQGGGLSGGKWTMGKEGGGLSSGKLTMEKEGLLSDYQQL